eukprot:c6435_g1_i1.p1 GENE.c6435_g1_i1~~c6435_g1_i1.p1  ORF type:complete len:710 (+),score=151.41 c6435_g1_i1:216-2345(+)
MHEASHGFELPPFTHSPEKVLLSRTHKHKTMTEAMDGTEVIKWDSYLEPHRDEIKARFQRYKTLKAQIEKHEGSLLEFAKPFSRLGFHYEVHEGKPGWRFAEWAPGAKKISLIGDFNGWDRESHVLTKGEYGVHSIFLPNKNDSTPVIPHNTKLKLHITTDSGEQFDRIPSMATYSVQNPETHAFDGVMWNPANPYQFQHRRPSRPPALRIYEAHVGIATPEPRVGTYKEFTNVLQHAKNSGYNAVQLMAVMEHSYYASFGYHVTNFFAPSSRNGTPDELKALIDEAHRLGLVVLMDIVHAHASSNQNDGIANLDGSGHQYFHAGPRGYHELWDSKLFNYGHWEVLRFLLSNLRYWMDEFKFDGFRFDGVTSMMFEHHGIGTGFSGGYHEYFGNTVDRDALVYLMLANDLVRQVHPECITIAEDVSGMPTLCRPVSEGGVGFDYRLAMAVPDMWIKLLKEKKDEDWNMGDIVWTLSNRRWMEPVIAYAESHDQALVGDKTIAFWLMDKEMYTHFSTMTEYTMVIQRGVALHKLIRGMTHTLGGEGWLAFMGNEFGHPEWLDFPREGNGWSYHYARRQYPLASNELLRYKHLLAFDRALNALDDKYHWLPAAPAYVSLKHEGDKVIVFERGGLLFVINLHPSSSYADYRIGVDVAGKYKIVLDSDREEYGGFNRYDLATDYFTYEEPWNNRRCSMMVYTISRTMLVFARV